MGYNITYSKVDATGQSVSTTSTSSFTYNSTIVDGVSMIGATIDQQGHLIISMSDGTTIDAGLVQGSGVDWSNVQITGGTIDNTIIGNVTPAAGTFTNLAATVLDSATLNGGYF